MEKFGFERVKTADKNKPKNFEGEAIQPQKNKKQSSSQNKKQADNKKPSIPQSQNKKPSSSKNLSKNNDISSNSSNKLSQKQQQIQKLEKQLQTEQEKKSKENQQFNEKMGQIQNQKIASKAVDEIITDAKKKAPPQDQKKQQKTQQEEPSQGLDGDIWKVTLDAIELGEQKKRNQGILPENFDLIPMKQSKDISYVERQQKSQSQSKQNQVDYKERERDMKNQWEIEKKLDQLQKKVDPLLGVYQTYRINNQKIKKNQTVSGTLIAKSAHRYVKLYADQITELLIDEILYDSVGVLNTWDEQNQRKEEERRNQEAMNDYIEAIKDFAMTQDQIDARFEKTQQSMMNFRKTQVENDPFLQVEQMEKDANFFKNPEDRVRSIEISSGFIMRVLDERKRRINYTRKKGIYQAKNLEIINQLVGQIGETLVHHADQKMENYAEQMAAQIFHNEFK